MVKILDTNNICDAIHLSQMPGATQAIRDIEIAVTAAAEKLAAYYNIRSDAADYQPGFAGLCVNFRPSYEGQECPEYIDSGDEGGEWE